LYFITCRKFREDLKSLIFCKSLTDLKWLFFVRRFPVPVFGYIRMWNR
jgi:hypothetical protein